MLKQQWLLDQEIGCDELAETSFAKAMRISAGTGAATTPVQNRIDFLSQFLWWTPKESPFQGFGVSDY